MVLNKFTPCQDIVIYQPRWHDGKVLIAKHKVGTHNQITFKYAPTYPHTYYLSGETIRKYPTCSNGKIEVYQVPLGEMEVLERSE